MKKVLYIGSIVLVCLLLTLVMLLAVVQSSQVQTAALRVVTQELSSALGTEMRVEKVNYRFPNKIEINGIYVEDLQKDTLLWVDTVKAKFDFFGFFNQKIVFSQAEVLHGGINAYTLDERGPQSTHNYDFFLALFPKSEESKGVFEQTVAVRDVSLCDLRLRYDDIRVSDINGDLSLNRFSRDSLDAEVAHLSFRESGGLQLTDLQANVTMSAQRADIRQLRVMMPRSEIKLRGSFVHPVGNWLTSADDNRLLFEQLFDPSRLNSAMADLEIEKADVVLSDVGRLLPSVKKVDGRLCFTTHINGTIDDLSASRLALDYKNYSLLRGDVSITGLPDIDTAYLHARLEDLSVNKAVLQDFLSDFYDKPYQLPSMVARLGQMHYKGEVDGRIDSLTLNGVFSSALGNITTHGSLSGKNNYEQLAFRGKVSTLRFALGKLLNQKDIGNIGLRLQVDATTGKNQPWRADLDGAVTSFQFRKYTYRNLLIDGAYSEKEFDGSLIIDDEHLAFNFNGMADFTQELPIVNGTLDISRLHLGDLNLSETYSDAHLSGKLTVNGSGNSLDNINGYLYVDSLLFERTSTDRSLMMRQLRVLAETGEQEKTNFKINSDFLNANLSGYYKFSRLPDAFTHLMVKYLPRMFNEKTRNRVLNQDAQDQIDYYVYFKNLDLLCDILDLPVSVGKMPTIKGFLNEKTEQFALQVGVPSLTIGGQQLDDITLNLDNRSKQVNLGIYAYKHASDNSAGDKMGDMETYLKATARRDSLYLDVSIENTDTSRTAGTIRTATHFAQYAGKALIDVHMLPSELVIADSLWTIADSHIAYSVADTTLQVNGFRIGNDNCFIYADGLASKRETDSINIQLRNIVLDYILEYTYVKRSIYLGGAITGWATAYGLFSSPMFEAEVWMKDADINHTILGDAHAGAFLNKQDKSIEIWGSVTENNDTIASVDGKVDIVGGYYDIGITADSANLAFINYWTQGIIEDIQGRGFGQVKVFGYSKGPEKGTYVTANAFAKDASLMIPYIGTRYFLNDSVTMDINSVNFHNITMRDEEGNPLYLDGVLTHDGKFKKFGYKIDVGCEKTLVMNLPKNNKEMFYGKVYASGDVRIRGDEDICRIFANARTDKNSSFTPSLGTASTARDNSFITFVEHRTMDKKNKQNQATSTASRPATKVLLDLQVEATRDALVNIIIDPRQGDELHGRGEGSIKLEYDVNNDDIQLYGTYTLESGEFYFTLENLIRKDFAIRKGSTITFQGDPTRNIYIDASAAYSTTASLRDLFGSEYNNIATNRLSVPVNCIIYLKENLMNPVISFGIELPQSDESVASQVRSIINTEEMLMREIIYLLVFNRFYTPEYLKNSANVGLNETYSLLSSTVSSQINNWIRRLTNNFSIGFNIRTDGEGKESSQEYETQFQYTPTNRLIINGNFGYRHNDISNQPIFGNLDVEYLLTPSGMWRAKAYTHTVDKYSLREAHTIQGVGFMFKYDFNGASSKKKKGKNTNKNNTDSIP